MKKYIVGAIVIVAMGCIVFGTDGFKGIIGGGREVVKSAVNKNTSTAFDVGRINSLIKTEIGKTADAVGELKDLKSRLIGEKKKVVKMELAMTEQKEAIAIAKGLLEQGKESYIIEGQSYTVEDIDGNVEWRLAQIDALKNGITISNSLISSLDVNYKNGMANIATVKNNIADYQNELKKLQAREMNAELQAKANELASSVAGLTDGLLNQSALKEAFDNYESKVSRKELNASGVDGAPVGVVIIPFNVTQVDSQTTIEKIDAALAN